MQEIAPGVYMGTEYIGATVGVVVMGRGTVYIDSPPCPEQARAWRNTIRNMGGGSRRALVYLDHHTDRALGGRLLDCPILAHEKTAQIFRARAAIFRAQSAHQGEAWERCPSISNVRWSTVHLHFAPELRLYWGDDEASEPLILQEAPGPAPGTLWAVLPWVRVIFVGDTVTLREPPFLALADPEAWMASLERLLSPAFRDYLVVAGRGGIAPHSEIRHMHRFLERVHTRLTHLTEKKAPPEAVQDLVPELLALWEFDPSYDDLYAERLRYGLEGCYQNHYLGKGKS